MPRIDPPRKRPWVESMRLPRKFGPKSEQDKKFYNSRLWRYKIRKPYLEKHPYCKQCADRSETSLATYLDHIIPIREDVGGSKTDERNYQGLCKTHHNIKRAKERHGYVAAWQLNDDGEKIPLQ